MASTLSATNRNLRINPPPPGSTTEIPGKVPGRVCTTQKLARALLIRLGRGELPRDLIEAIAFGRQPDEGLLHGAYAVYCSMHCHNSRQHGRGQNSFGSCSRSYTPCSSCNFLRMAGANKKKHTPAREGVLPIGFTPL